MRDWRAARAGRALAEQTGEMTIEDEFLEHLPSSVHVDMQEVTSAASTHRIMGRDAHVSQEAFRGLGHQCHGLDSTPWTSARTLTPKRLPPGSPSTTAEMHRIP